MTDISQIEADLSITGQIGAMVGGPVGLAVDAGLQAGEAVVNTVQTSQAAHATALDTAAAAVGSLASAAAPAVAALPPDDAAKAAAGLNMLQSVLAELKSIFSL